jgi:hypothetical protein
MKKTKTKNLEDYVEVQRWLTNKSKSSKFGYLGGLRESAIS